VIPLLLLRLLLLLLLPLEGSLWFVYIRLEWGLSMWNCWRYATNCVHRVPCETLKDNQGTCQWKRNTRPP
jgi:hypothetical protein